MKYLYFFMAFFITVFCLLMMLLTSYFVAIPVALFFGFKTFKQIRWTYGIDMIKEAAEVAEEEWKGLKTWNGETGFFTKK